MKTIELTIDESLLAEIDRVTKELSLTQSTFINQALEAELRRQLILALERQQADGYARCPVEPGEFDGWEDKQVWEEQ